jgi:hypothetical protein
MSRTHLISPSLLSADFTRLGVLLKDATGSAAAALVRERRILSAELEGLVAPEEVPFVDQLAPRRIAKAGDPGAPSRRRKPG